MVRILSADRSKDAGFTAAELLIVLALSGTVLAITFGFFQSARATFQGDSDMRVVEWQLKLARETAINQRRVDSKCSSRNPNLITVVRNNLPDGTTVISTIYLEHNAKFMQFAGHARHARRFRQRDAGRLRRRRDRDVHGRRHVHRRRPAIPSTAPIFIGQPGQPRHGARAHGLRADRARFARSAGTARPGGADMRRLTDARTRDAGFTLVEVLVAMVLLAASA